MPATTQVEMAGVIIPDTRKTSKIQTIDIVVLAIQLKAKPICRAKIFNREL
jgi:hypothetical protein